MKDDLDFLVAETLKHSGDFVGHNPFAFMESYPEAPGFIYKLEKGVSTFVLRILETQNISVSMEELNQDEALRKSLRLEANQGLNELKYFETPTIEIALAVKDRLCNKRFPRNEQTLCNLSDPGFSWWLSHTPTSISISFKNYRLDDNDEYQSIGALGDSRLSATKLTQCQSLLRELFPVGHFFCNENLFGLETTNANIVAFEKFKRLFLEGRDIEELFDVKPHQEKHKASLVFLREISFVRKFWKRLESELMN